MTPERWKQIEQLYHAALKLEPGQRVAFLQETCAGDKDLRGEVESLLAHEPQDESFIRSTSSGSVSQGLMENQTQSVTEVVSRSKSCMIGQTVSHYRILEKLGEGGMGVVYKAQDLKLERWVALKFLPPHISPDEEEMIRFVREAKAASTLDHPNIGTIHEIANTDDGQMFIVMAYYEGETLKQKIERGPLPVKEAVDIAIQITRGLAKAHSQQIVHRDIKPGNVIVTKEGLVKIIDFGLAKLGGFTKITKTHTTMGTVSYMSPEQARGEEVDQKADVWSFGVVLYEMLTGRVPFPGDQAETIIHAILTAKPKPLKQLRGDAPAEVERIVRRALEKSLKSRYGSGAAVLKDLTDYQSSLVLPEMQLGGWKLFSRWIRQKQVAIPGILLLLVFGLLLWWYFHRQAKVRWAREQALPEISQLADEGNFTAAFNLAQAAEKYIPSDSRLLKLWPVMSSTVSLHITPPGAKVYLKEYAAIDSAWTYLGESPLEKIRIPWGLFRWKVEKKGFVMAEDVGSGAPGVITFTLDQEGNILPGMVHIRSGGSPVSIWIPGFEHFEPVQLPDYWMDKYEVTNKQFKKFVDSDGYQKQEYWKHPFFKDGRVISLGQAMAEFRDATGRLGPSTWETGDYPKGQDDYPVSGVSWYEAAAYAEFVGKSLPTLYHWSYTAIADGSYMTSYLVPLSNFRGKGLARVGSYPGMSRGGTYDMAGNVKEWCWNEGDDNKRYILGGAWDEPTYMFNNADAHLPFHRYANFGFRCVKYSSLDSISKTAFGPVASAFRDYDKEQPVSPEILRAYQSLYSYDKTALNPIIESVDESDPDWKKEKITFDAAYGKDRIIAYLLLPKTFAPPYQVITYFPGSYAIDLRTSKDLLDMWLIGFILKSGRAILYPVYKGTYERGDGLKSDCPDTTSFYRDHVIYWSKDLGRSIDYLETRPDIDHNKIGYYGFSWGAGMGAIMPALEDRFKVSVLASGGFYQQKTLPEVDQINFAPHVRIPVLMLNGRYDFSNPFETSQEPMSRLLGTPKEHKRLAIFESGHVIPRNQLIKETLDWLDRYLGAVKRREL